MGIFSAKAKAIKLAVKIDEEKSQIKVYAPILGILFDTGNHWQVTASIINGHKPNNTKTNYAMQQP